MGKSCWNNVLQNASVQFGYNKREQSFEINLLQIIHIDVIIDIMQRKIITFILNKVIITVQLFPYKFDNFDFFRGRKIWFDFKFPVSSANMKIV
jgi:hypothetical protein